MTLARSRDSARHTVPQRVLTDASKVLLDSNEEIPIRLVMPFLFGEEALVGQAQWHL